jgi:phosphopantetheinyl transferase
VSWLRGRAALKRLLAEHGPQTDTSTIVFPHRRLSLTHSGDYAVAMAVEAPGQAGVGVDIELDREPRSSMARFFLSDAERETDWSLADLLRLWTVKEALFKADPGNAGHSLTDYNMTDCKSHVGTASVRHDSTLWMRYASVPLDGGFLSAAISFREAER